MIIFINYSINILPNLFPAYVTIVFKNLYVALGLIVVRASYCNIGSIRRYTDACTEIIIRKIPIKVVAHLFPIVIICFVLENPCVSGISSTIWVGH